MKNEKLKNFIKDVIFEIKAIGLSAKKEADNASSEEIHYKNGYLMALHSVVSLLKNQAIAFEIDQKEIGLDDIEPEEDLL